MGESKLPPSGDLSSGKTGSGSRFGRAPIWGGVVVSGIVLFVLGYLVAPRHHHPSPGGIPPSAGEIRYWTCSMHPQIRLPTTGKCPICFMDLIPVHDTLRGGESGSAGLVLSDRARELAEIETSAVEYRPLRVTVRMAGRIDYDETRVGQVSAWVPGRIDRLYANFVGVRVTRGDHLFLIYSPELRTAQEEFLIALRRWEAVKESGDTEELSAAEAVRDATRRRLELLGLLPAQFDELARTRRAADQVTIHAPVGGTIVAREAFEGKYAEVGERLFTIVDLSKVWAMLEAYEIDLAWLQYGEEVEFETESYPGDVFKGRIAFIQPFVNEMTRTVKVRVNVPNPGEHLKAGMFVRARVRVTLDEAGKVRAPDLNGKWMCRMHPEIVKDTRGTCDDCDMELVEPTSLGFGRVEVPVKRVLSVPATAPLLTGARAVVYVEERRDGETRYVGRQIELGPRAGDYYAVLSGLEEGERVVTRGNFKIDAAMQIQARPSMMKSQETAAPDHQPPPAGDAGTAATRAPRSSSDPEVDRVMRTVLELYLSLADSLASDRADEASRAIATLSGAFPPARKNGSPVADDVKNVVATLREILQAKPPQDLEAQRQLLATLTGPIGEYLRFFGHRSDRPLYEAFCPMAFGGKGHAWFQTGRDIRNPYFGARMFRCGEIRREIQPVAGEKDE